MSRVDRTKFERKKRDNRKRITLFLNEERHLSFIQSKKN